MEEIDWEGLKTQVKRLDFQSLEFEKSGLSLIPQEDSIF